MAIIYFLSTVFLVWTVYNLYHPATRNFFLMIFSSFLGLIVGEFTLHVLLLEVLGTLFFFSIGSIDGVLGIAGMILTLGSWAAMLIFYWHANNVRFDAEEGLYQALGRDYKDKIKHEILATFDEKTTFKRIAKPWPITDPQVEVLKNIVYARAGKVKLKLDIYKNKETFVNRPVLLQIHGGWWTRYLGSKKEQAVPLMSYLAEKGWICVSIDYRLAPKSPYPAQIIDCKKALAWIKENIADYGGDPDFVIATGGSAGGHLASLLALTANDPDLQPGFEKEDTSVQGCIPYHGIYDFTDSNQLQNNSFIRTWVRMMVMQMPRYDQLEKYQQASPLFRIHANAPPFLLVHGVNDTLVSFDEAEYFAAELKKASKQSVGFIGVSGGQHGFDILPSLRSEYVKFAVYKFISYLHSDYLNKIAS